MDDSDYSLDNLLQAEEYIDLKAVEPELLAKYTCDYIIQEYLASLSHDTIQNISSIPTTSSSITTLQTSSSSFEKSKPLSNQKKQVYEYTSITINDIPKKNRKDAIDFVNFIEYEFPNEKMQKLKKNFTLKKNEESGQLKYELVEISSPKELNSCVYEKDIEITAAITFENYLITGDTLGILRVYLISDNKLFKQFPCPIKGGNSFQINSIDISEDGNYLITGYITGLLAIFDLKSNKIKKPITCDIHKNSCINVKFISNDTKNNYVFISTGINGEVNYTEIKPNFGFGFSVKTDQILISEQFPTFLIKLVKFNENQLNFYSFLNQIHKTIILANLEKITIIQAEPKLKSLWNISRPNFLENSNTYAVPDICMGIGKLPTSREQSDEDFIEPQIIMVVSWDNVIYIYQVPVSDSLLTPILTGHYINENQIIRCGFLSKSTLYIIDKYYGIKILNTRKFIKGEVLLTEETFKPKAMIKNAFAEIQNNFGIFPEGAGGDVIKQINICSPDKKYKETFLNSILENLSNQNILILTNKKSIYFMQLVNYEKCLRDLQKKNKWMEMFILGIEIYKGKMTSLCDIPQDSEDRKKTVREYLQNIVSQYIFQDEEDEENSERSKDNKSSSNSIIGKRRNSFYDMKKKNEKTEDKIEIIIEFCIEIEAIDYLLDKILKIYESKGYGDLFLSKLESFILCNKIKQFDINEDIIMNIIKLYENKKKFVILSDLLLHIDIRSLSNPTVKEKIISLNLITPTIYIFLNDRDKNYIEPVLKLYELFTNADNIKLNEKNLNKNVFSSYENLIEEIEKENKKILDEENEFNKESSSSENKNKIITLNDIFNSKEYHGHKLLWYIKKSLTGKKFPYFEELLDHLYFTKYTIDLVYWLLKSKIMTDLVQFDSYYYFDILTRIFTEEKFLKIIEKNNKSSAKQKEGVTQLNEDHYQFKFPDVSPLSLVLYIIQEGKKFNSQTILLDLYIFTVNVNKYVNLSENNKELVIETLISILSEYNLVKGNQIDEKKFSKLIKTITDILNDDKNFFDNDYRYILLRFHDHIFDEIRIFMFNKINSYIECFDLYIDENCHIPGKAEKFYSFIKSVLSKLMTEKLSGGDDRKFNDFKNYVLNNLIRVGEVMDNKFDSFVFSFFFQTFEDKKKTIVRLAEKPEKQFTFVEILADSYFQNYKENENNIVGEDKDWVVNILKLYISLLCVLNKKDQILPCIKKCALYPVEYCLKLCEQYQVKDALIHLYQILGDIPNAIKVSLEIVENNYNTIYNSFTKGMFNENEFLYQLNEFNKSINTCIEILTSHEEQMEKIQHLWFNISSKLYDIDNKFKLLFLTTPEKKTKYYYQMSQEISNNLKDLLEKMCLYVGINQILEITSQNNRQAGCKEFKPIIIKVLETYDNQSSLLHCVGRLLTNACYESQSELENISKKGEEFHLRKCDVCKNSFNQSSEEFNKICVFRCGHILHHYCSYTEEQEGVQNSVCPICRQNEIESVISNIDYDLVNSKPTINTKNLYEIKKIKQKKENINKYGINLDVFRKGFKRMITLDNNHSDTSKMFFTDSVNACRKEYRLKAKPKKVLMFGDYGGQFGI